jgi:ComF family protein
MPATSDLASTDGCPRCRAERFHFDQAVSLGRYEGLTRQAALRTKRSSERALALAVGELLSRQFVGGWQGLRFDAVVPVPMHWSRRMWRGANCPDTLCEPIGRHLGLPVASHILTRAKRTQPQANLSPGRRRRNLRGAFQATQHADLPGARLLLIDDIMTTGATVSEAAKTLKRAGASFVAVAVVARAEGLV